MTRRAGPVTDYWCPHDGALLELAEQRRIALAAYARRARQDPNVAEIVRLMLASRRKRVTGGGNVIRMEGRRG